MEVKRFEVYLICLDPTIGHEIKKTRPCVIISPNEMNKYLQTVIIAPLTTTHKSYPTRINLSFHKKKGQIALDQLRTIDQARLIKKVGKIDSHASSKTLSVLQEMFC